MKRFYLLLAAAALLAAGCQKEPAVAEKGELTKAFIEFNLNFTGEEMTKADYAYYDYLIGMDSINISYMTRIAGGDPEGKILKLLPIAGISRDVADPWYTGDFSATWQDVLTGCTALLEKIG